MALRQAEKQVHVRFRGRMRTGRKQGGEPRRAAGAADPFGQGELGKVADGACGCAAVVPVLHDEAVYVLR